MPTNHYNQGEREFTLRVISPLNGEIPFRAGAIADPDKNPMYVELNLNPSNRIYENPNKKQVQGGKDVPIFDAAHLKTVFKYLIDFIEHLEKEPPTDNKNDQPIDIRMIDKIIMSKNSPARIMISESHSYNGDMPLPR